VFPKILFSLLAFSTSIFAYELNFDKTFKQEVPANILMTQISIDMNSKDEDSINDTLQDINYFFKNNNTIKKSNGSFSLTPKYTYKNNAQKFLHYSGKLSYTISSTKAANLNEFISELGTLKKELKQDKLKITLQNMRWQISKELRELSSDTLRLSAINWIQNYSASLKMSCTTKNINIKSNNNFSLPRSYKMKSFKVSNNVAPINTKQNINMHVNYILECK
jgi:predicted secreted protein